MLEKINSVLNIIMGSCVGVFIGHGMYVFWDSRIHPDLYAMHSAPWYASIFVYGIVTIIVLIAANIAKGMIRYRLKQKKILANRQVEIRKKSGTQNRDGK